MALRQVTQGPGRCLLSVEFPGDSSGPGLAAALAAHGGDYEIWRFDPVTTLDLQTALHDYPTLARLCAAELQRLRPGADPAVSVVGYCSAARFAHHVARSLTTAGLAPHPLVLVAPWTTTEQTVWDEFRVLCRKLTGEAPTKPPFPVLDDPTAAIGWLAAQLADQAHSFVAAAGYEPADAEDAVNEIVGRYRAWLWFLLQAAQPSMPQVHCPVTQVARNDRPPKPGATTTPPVDAGDLADLVLRAVRTSK